VEVAVVWRVAPVPVRPVKDLRDVSPQALNRHHQRTSVTRREALDPVLSLVDVAVEALREAWHEQRMSSVFLWLVS